MEKKMKKEKGKRKQNLAKISVCSLLTLFSESYESSMYGAPALYCYNV
jgi:hypothetical protein